MISLLTLEEGKIHHEQPGLKKLPSYTEKSL